MTVSTDYSQSGEQEHILQFAAEFEQAAGHQGRFLDIGAFDGVTFSNTRALAERGWAGVCVEPAAHAFHKLALLYKGRDDVVCVNALVGEPGLHAFWYAHTDLVSTTDLEHVRLWRPAADFAHTVVQGLPFATLFHAFPGPYDVISIDTEGSELNLLESLAVRGYLDGVGLVVVEPTRAKSTETVLRIVGREWRAVARTANNLILRRTA